MTTADSLRPAARTVTLRDGACIPSVAFGGGARIGDPRIFEAALHAGFRLIDTAVSYGNQHAILASDTAKRLAADGEPVLVCTKVMPTERLPDVIEGALRELRRDRIDVLLLHYPLSEPFTIRDHVGILRRTWEQFEQLVAKQRVRTIGTSNAGIGFLRFIVGIASVPPAINQIECHPYLVERDLVGFCDANRIRVLAYCPLGSPWRVGPQNSPLVDATIQRIARTHARSPAQIVLRWHVERGIVPVVSARDEHRMRENLDLWTFSLAEAEHRAIDALGTIRRVWRETANRIGLQAEVRAGRVYLPRCRDASFPDASVLRHTFNGLTWLGAHWSARG